MSEVPLWSRAGKDKGQEEGGQGGGHDFAGPAPEDRESKMAFDRCHPNPPLTS